MEGSFTAAAAAFCFLCDLDFTSVNGASVSADWLSASGLVDVERAVQERKEKEGKRERERERERDQGHKF